jgi:phosphatidylglycerophosphate synthase
VVAAGEAGLVLHVTTEPERLQAERTLRDSVFKPTDANLARFNRRLSIPLSVALIRWARLSPHTMSVGVAAFGVYAGWLFSRGTYASGIAGALVSLAASILDGCDGELARLQYKESAFGTWLDTIGDYLYYVAVFGGMAVGLTVHRETQVYEWIGVAAILGMVATFALLIVLRRQLTRDHPERLRATMRAHFDANRQWWSRALTSISTCTTRATLPYGILGFALLHRLDWLLAIVAFASHVYWIRLAVELRRLLAVSTEDGQWPVPARAPGA